jgi:hypothetical protein
VSRDRGLISGKFKSEEVRWASQQIPKFVVCKLFNPFYFFSDESLVITSQNVSPEETMDPFSLWYIESEGTNWGFFYGI